MNANKGWLKPKRLKELAGTQAMQVEAENIQEERKRKKRARYLKKYRARMKKMAKPGHSMGAPPNKLNKSKEIAPEEIVKKKPVINLEPPSESLLKPIKNLSKKAKKVDKFVYHSGSSSSDSEEEMDVVARMPHIVSRSPRAVRRLNIINLAIGAKISNVEEAAQVEAIRAQQSRE